VSRSSRTGTSSLADDVRDYPWVPILPPGRTASGRCRTGPSGRYADSQRVLISQACMSKLVCCGAKSTAASCRVGVAGWCTGVAVAHADPTPAPPPAPSTTIDADGTYAVRHGHPAGDVQLGRTRRRRRLLLETRQRSNIVDNALSKKSQIVQIEPDRYGVRDEGLPAMAADRRPGCRAGGPIDLLGPTGPTGPDHGPQPRAAAGQPRAAAAGQPRPPPPGN